MARLHQKPWSGSAATYDRCVHSSPETRTGAVKGQLAADAFFATRSFLSAPFLLLPHLGICELSGRAPSKVCVGPEQQWVYEVEGRMSEEGRKLGIDVPSCNAST